MITLLIVYELNNMLVAAVSGWLWHAKGWRSGYHKGVHDGVRQVMAQRLIKRPAEPAEPGTGVARSTEAGDVLRGTAGQPQRGAGSVVGEGWADTPPGPPGDDARPPPWRVEAGGDQSPVLGLRRDRARILPERNSVTQPG